MHNKLKRTSHVNVSRVKDELTHFTINNLILPLTFKKGHNHHHHLLTLIVAAPGVA